MIFVRLSALGAILLPLMVDADTRDDDVAAPERVPGRAWMKYAEPAEAGFSAEKLAEARKYSEEIGSAAVMVVHDGAVLAHWGEIGTRFMCHSVRKSFLSALYGIHVGEGTVDPEKTLAELGIDDVDPLSAQEKQASVRDLLKSRSGVYHAAAYETAAMKRARPERGSHSPGTFYYYNNWDFNALASILDDATGSTVFREFDSRLAGPLGMQDYRVRDGYYHLEIEHSKHPAYPFRMSARDMARFGLLYLRDGKWGDKQIVPEGWVRESTRTQSEVDEKRGYGYLWWTVREEPFALLGTYAARGFGGHSIAVVPGANLVLVHRVDTWWDLDFPGCAKRQVVKVNNARRLKLLGMIFDARESEPKPEPELVPLPETHSESEVAAPDPKRATRLAGTYGFADGRTIEVRQDDGGLLVHVPRAGVFRLLPVPGGAFAMEDLGASVSAILQADGSPLALEIGSAPAQPVYGRPIREGEAADHSRLRERLGLLVPRLMEGLTVPGVSIAVIRDGDSAFERGYGVMRAGGSRPVTSGTVFEACSMSKVAYAYVVMKLAEEGVVDLDKPLAEYLDTPYLEDEPQHRDITARMVLAHTTGFPNWRKGGWRKGGPIEMKFAPGTQYGYSGEGFLYLQRVIEHLTGEPLEEMMKQRLLDPLGMTASSYLWEDRYEQLASAGHDQEGSVKENRPHYDDANAAYTLYCTPGDYARFLIEVMKEGRAEPCSISAESLAEMFRPHIAVAGSHGKPVPRPEGDEFVSVDRGLGWVVGKTKTGGQRAWHSGANGSGFRCHAEFDRAQRDGIVIMTGSVNGAALCREVIRLCEFP